MRTLQVLVVDDEQIVLDSVKKLLRKENYTIHTALSAADALALMDETAIDIVLADLMMPETDGLELMKLVAERDEHIPVIMITGYATINTALQAKQLGAFDYIAKPFSKTELQGVVRRAAELVAARPTTATADTAETTEVQSGTEKTKKSFQAVGENSWMTLEQDGTVLLGVQHAYLSTIGKIQTLNLPTVGDEIRQGGVVLQIYSADLRSHTVLSPLTGTVVDVNNRVLDEPEAALEDPYESGWLIRLQPSRFEQEIKELGLL